MVLEKLGVRKIQIEMDDCPECIALGFDRGEYAITLGSTGRPTDELTPILYSPKVEKARDFLRSRGVRVREIQRDRQGARYFKMQDLEGNVIEVTEEP